MKLAVLISLLLLLVPASVKAAGTTGSAVPYQQLLNEFTPCALRGLPQNCINTGLVGQDIILSTVPSIGFGYATAYGITPGLAMRADGQIAGGCSTGSTDLCGAASNFQTLGVQPGWLVVVLGAGVGGNTLVGGAVVSVSNSHLILTNGAATAIASGAYYIVAPDMAPAIQIAVNNATGTAIRIPAGTYCVGSQITQSPTGQRDAPGGASLVTIFGDGPGQTILVACAAMTTTGTNEAVFYRSSTFGIGGGLQNLTVEAVGLANEGIFWAGGGTAVNFNVWVENAIVSDWQCGDGTHQASGNRFIAIRGDTNSNFFSSAQEAQYNFYTHHTGCTDSWIVDSTFSNASVRNIYDDGPSQGNHYIRDHPFNASGYTPPYSIEMDGMGIVADNEMDGGGTTAGIYVNGNNILVENNHQFINGGWTQGNMIEIASGKQNVVVIGNGVRSSDLVPAANVVVQDGSAGSGTIVANNSNASYSYPGVTCSPGSPSSSFTTSGGTVTHC